MDPFQITELVQSDPAANSATELLTDAGGTVYVVGGAVRDAALGKNPKDIDLMVTGLDEDAIKAALQGHGWIDMTGKAFGVFRFKTNNSEVEIAMPRVEYGDTNTDFNVDPSIGVGEDLLRRDFTANAMAVNPNTGELIDPYGGMDDLSTKTLRLANPGGFGDDPTRLLRAITAYSKSGLYPDAATFAAMKEEAPKLESQPGERLSEELDKILSGGNPAGALRLAVDTGLMKWILPEVDSAMGFDQMNPHHDLDVGTHLLAALEKMTELSNDPDLRLAALLHDIGKPDSFWQDPQAPQGGGGHFYKKQLDAAKPEDTAIMNQYGLNDGDSIGEMHEDLGADYAQTLMTRLRFPNDRIARVSKLIKWHMFPYFENTTGARRFLNNIGGDPKVAFDLLKLREADSSGKASGEMKPYDAMMIEKDRELVQKVVDQNEAVTRKDLKLDGNDLIAMGLKPGPEIGSILDKLLDVVIENPELNTKADLSRLAQGFLGKTAADNIDDDYYQNWIQQVNDTATRLDEKTKQQSTQWDYLDHIHDAVSDEEWNQMTPEQRQDYEDNYFEAQPQPQQQMLPAIYGPSKDDSPERKRNLQMYFDALPHFKWSWNGYELDVWPTKSWMAEDHFERTGPMFREMAQGRIYIDTDGKLELFVWANRGTKKEREKAVEAVEEWMLHNLGRESDVVTYEGEYMPTAPKDNFAPAHPTTDPSQFTFPLEDSPYLDEEDHQRARSIHDFTDEEWERMERDGRVFR